MRLLVLAALVFTAAPAAHAQVTRGLADLRLATAVRLALVEDVRTRPLDVAVVADGGGVQIEGEVPPAERRTVDEVARRVPGVVSVNGLGTLADGPDAPAVQIQPQPAPPEADPTPAAGPVYHTVARGETLFRIALLYDTSVEALLRLNGRAAPDIRVGERLRVR